MKLPLQANARVFAMSDSRNVRQSRSRAASVSLQIQVGMELYARASNLFAQLPVGSTLRLLRASPGSLCCRAVTLVVLI
jgi:hypothetical protein